MSQIYSNVKLGKLKLKGEKKKKSKSGKKRKHEEDGSGPSGDGAADTDMTDHGGWRSIIHDVDVRGGNIAIECHSQCYLSSLDNGKFTVGPPHAIGEEPAPEEVLTLIRTPESNWVAFKSGYGKYVSCGPDGRLEAIQEAIGAKERWEFVFEDGKVALQSLANHCFVSSSLDKEGYVHASSRVAKENEVIQIRTLMEKVKPVDWTPAEDKKNAKDCETAYQKMFQHSKVDLVNKCISIDVNDRVTIKRAKDDGNLHEVLLDRRMKKKSDKYC